MSPAPWPRRSFTYFLEAPLRRRGLVLAPVVFLSLAAAAIAQLLPPRYSAAALVRAEWDTADEALLQQRGIELASRRNEAVGQRVTDRVALERVLREASPYTTGPSPASLDEQVERLLSDLRVRPMASSSFVIEFAHTNPATAALVPNLLARQLVAGESGGTHERARFELLRDAEIPRVPEAPSPILFVLAGALAGLVTGLAAAVVSEHRDRRVRGPEDLEDVLPVPLLATLPEVRARGQR
jgi:uncharacterized protein involved in exopolysaccharide biosynthesis